MGGAVEAATAEIGREEEGQCGADLSSSPRDTHPDSLNSCNARELEASSSICSSVTSTEMFSLLLSKLCCRVLKTRPLEQQNSVTLLSTFTLPVSEKRYRDPCWVHFYLPNNSGSFRYFSLSCHTPGLPLALDVSFKT